MVHRFFLERVMDNYLEMMPLSGIAKYEGAQPKDTLAFDGFPRQHPSEKNKLILVHDPAGPIPTVMEFKLEDIMLVEDVPSAVTEEGEGIPLVKLWVRRGAHGVILEPFEVNNPIHFANKSMEIRERFLGV
jgi:inorganic pyrophosphatase